jgi:hypothetical protein
MTDCLAAAVLVAIVEMHDLAAFAFAYDRGDDGGARHFGLADQDLIVLLDQQDIVQSHLIANGVGQNFDVNFVADGDAVLLSASFQYCKHTSPPFTLKRGAIILGNNLFVKTTSEKHERGSPRSL